MWKNFLRNLRQVAHPTKVSSTGRIMMVRDLNQQNNIRNAAKKVEKQQWGYLPPAVTPDQWHILYPIANGSRQSPIDIKEKHLEKDASLQTIQLMYNPSDITHVNNSGSSVTFVADGKKSILTGAGLNGRFRLLQFHFHWGAEDTRGSEHTLNGKYFSAEIHLVHLNTAYSSFEDALSHGDGLCVIGAFLQADDNGAEGYDRIAELISKVKYKGQTHHFDEGIDARTLLPQDQRSFATYEGSLTTPPLSECVQWINLIKPVKISRETLEAFRSLHVCEKGEGKQCIVDNYRPVQHLHDRKICCFAH